MSRKRWASVKWFQKYTIEHVWLCTKCTVNRLEHLWFIRHDICTWKNSIWLPTANLPERAAEAGHRRRRMWWAQVLWAPLWSVLWARGRGGTPDEDQQLPVSLSPTKDLQTHLAYEQVTGQLDQPRYRGLSGPQDNCSYFFFGLFCSSVLLLFASVCQTDRLLQ